MNVAISRKNCQVTTQFSDAQETETFKLGIREPPIRRRASPFMQNKYQFGSISSLHSNEISRQAQGQGFFHS